MSAPHLLPLWILLALAVAPGGAACAADGGTDGVPARRHAAGLRFDSEVVRLRVRADSVEVEGHYTLLCPPPQDHRPTLFYPYPVDSLLGGAITCDLACRVGRGPWRPATFREVAPRPGIVMPGARWSLPACAGDTLEVRTVYRQALLASYARYIVTTTRAWQRPLRHARFEIHLPDGVDPQRFSFPFARVEEAGEVFYVYEVDQFFPDRDVIVEWSGQRSQIEADPGRGAR